MGFKVHGPAVRMYFCHLSVSLCIDNRSRKHPTSYIDPKTPNPRTVNLKLRTTIDPYVRPEPLALDSKTLKPPTPKPDNP